MKNAVILSAIGLLLLASCQKSPEPTSPENMTIRLAYATLPHAGLVHIALEKGYFDRQGLTIVAQPYPFGKPALATVIAGDSDLATCADTPFVVATLAGKNVAVAATISSSDKTTALIADKDAGVSIPDDLAGKTIGVAKGTTAEFLLELLLLARGVEKSRVRIVDMLPDDMQAALLDGRIAAAVVRSPYLEEISATLAARAVIMYGNDLHTEHFFVTGELGFMQSHPEAMRAFMRALIKAEAFAIADPDEALSIIARYAKTDPAKIRSTMQQFRLQVSLNQSAVLLITEGSRWARSLDASNPAPLDLSNHIYSDALSYVAPERVRLVR